VVRGGWPSKAIQASRLCRKAQVERRLKIPGRALDPSARSVLAPRTTTENVARQIGLKANPTRPFVHGAGGQGSRLSGNDDHRGEEGGES